MKKHQNKKTVILIAAAVLLRLSLVAQVDIISEPDSADRVRMEYEFSFSEGAKQKMLGNLDQAENFYSRCIQLLPHKPAPYYELASLAYVKGDIESARSFGEQAINLDPSNKWYKFLGIEMAVLQERYADGAGYYRQLSEKFPDQLELRNGEIDLLMRAGDFKASLKRLDELEKDFGYSRFCGIKRKEVYLATGKDKMAYKEMERMIREFPDEVEVIGILAELYAEKGEEKKALDLYEKMKSMNSGNPLVYFSLGKYYLDLGRNGEAIAEFQTGFVSKQVNPEIKIQVFLELVNMQSSENQLNEQLETLLGVMYNTDKGHPNVDGLYAEYIFNRGDEKEAEEIYKRITKTTPSNFLAWQNLLFIQNNQLDFEEMYSIAHEAAGNYPNQPLFLLFKGIAAIQTNRLDEAVEALKAGMAVNINNSELTKQFFISLGDAYYQKGDYEQAFRNFENLLALDPDNVIVLNNYSYYLALLGQKPDKAMEMIERCIKQEPDNPTYLDTYAWVLYKNNEYEKALEVIEKAIALSDDPSGEVLEHYGDILFRNNKPEKALEIWKNAKEAGGAGEEIDTKIESGLR